jgi:uncharacterized membrane protein (UPF0136 family)
MSPKDKILWIYIIFLVVGGMVGFFKAKSQVSLVMSVVFAVALSLCAAHVILRPLTVSNLLLIALVVVFSIRAAKTRKFMPAGLMLAVTLLTLALRII